MEEIGKIVEVKENTVKVELTRKGGCGDCPAKMLCRPGGDKMYAEALSIEGVEVGDTVKVDMDPREVTIVAFLVFIFPILAFILGFGIIRLITKSQSAALVGGISMFAGCIVVLKIIDKNISKGRRFRPVVKRIVKKIP